MKTGDLVTCYNETFHGHPLPWGEAVLIQPASGFNSWVVRPLNGTRNVVCNVYTGNYYAHIAKARLHWARKHTP